MKKTKAELEIEVKQLTEANEKLVKENKTLRGKAKLADIPQGGTFRYLYKAVGLSFDYLTDLVKRTKSIRETTYIQPDSVVNADIRRWPDGNQICITMTKPLDSEDDELPVIEVVFFKKVDNKE